jgi:hypothetical protein
MENLNLKYEFLNYNFHSIKDLIRKNHNSKYIKKFGHQNPSKFFFWYQCYYIILPLNPLLIKNHYMKVHGVHIHSLWIIIGFWVSF